MKIKNELNSTIYFIIQNKKYEQVLPSTLRSFQIEEKETLSIYWKNVLGIENYIIKNIIPYQDGTYRIYSRDWHGIPGYPRLEFTPGTKGDNIEYNDGQYLQVCNALKEISQCNCYKNNCPCIKKTKESKSLRVWVEYTGYLVTKGVLSYEQLVYILKEILE